MADDLKDTLTNAAPLQRRSLLKGTAGILAAGMFPAVHSAEPIVLRYLGTAVPAIDALTRDWRLGLDLEEPAHLLHIEGPQPQPVEGAEYRLSRWGECSGAAGNGPIAG